MSEVRSVSDCGSWIGRTVSSGGPTSFCARHRLFRPSGARPLTEELVSFIDQHLAAPGVEPICKQLPIAPSTYYEYKARASDPARAPARVKRDRALCREIQRVWDENYQVYGARKVWRQLKREGHDVARCTVERLMRRLEIQGVRRGGKRCTTVYDEALPQPADRVNRQFAATRPNRLWVADLTFGAPSLQRCH